MINDEENREGSSGVVSLDETLGGELLSWKVRGQRFEGVNNDGLPGTPASLYSSCGESEFDRYCSANSVMGTPSICGSVGTFQDFHDSDLGSVKSSKLGDVGGLENFSLSGKVDRNLEDNNSLSLGRLGECSERRECFDVMRGSDEKKNVKSEGGLVIVENGLNSFDQMENSFPDFPDEGSVISWKDSVISKTMQSSSDNKSSTVAFEESMLNPGLEEGLQSHMCTEQFNGVFEGGYSDEHAEQTLSQYEHSEGEDSMYGYGTDHEENFHLPPRGYNQYSQDKKSKNENSLLMTSSTAYGSDDWDDFIQESMENPQASLGIDEFQGQNQQLTTSDGQSKAFTAGLPSIDAPKQQVEVEPINMQVDVTNTLPICSATHSIDLVYNEEEQGGNRKDLALSPKESGCASQIKMEEVSQTVVAPVMDELHREPACIGTAGTTDSNAGYVISSDLNSYSRESAEDKIAEMLKDHKSYSLWPLSDINVKERETSSSISLNVLDVHPTETKVKSSELDEFFDEVVHEMEEILLDSTESPAARFTHGRKHQPQVSLPSRDGGSTASTSSMDDSQSLIQNTFRIDGVEVVGARQKKGDVSLGERLVGVKEYTVYKLRVWGGTHRWEVERRYRDFFTLYRRLKKSFASKGWVLPSPWSLVDQESRKFFGNASPDVVSVRSVLIQECLQSILQSRFSSSLPSSLVWFLSPPNSGPIYPAFNTHLSQSQISSGSLPMETSYSLGQSISLIVEIKPRKSVEQILEAQHYTCAGCHKQFDEGKTRMWEFVQTLGWGSPRLCEYSGQLFCSSCHVNETAILPARVLHLWDFTEYPVSQLAKSYLDSIHDQPMLCVSAVNPFLFSKVPALQQVTNVRKRIGQMLPYVRCPFRRSICKGVGSRRYILESNDFFALKDLVDLSKGVFAALPVIVETVSKRIVKHITDECLQCYDVGVPCSARHACEDPSSLIFPFQEGEVERCRSCELVYHKDCFKKIATCPCGVALGATAKRSPSVGANKVDGTLNNLVQKTDLKSPVGLLYGLFSKASPAKIWGPKDNDTVISMGSLPSSSL